MEKLKEEFKTLIIGHRGCPHYEPENTLRSFKKALEHGADMIELDVHLTKDKKLIVMHDSDLSRMTGLDKEIKKLTLKEIEQISVEGEKIPTLEETIDFLKGKCMMNIEAKVKEAADPIVNLVIEKDAVEDVILASRSTAFLVRVKQLNPFIKTSWVIERPLVWYIFRAKMMGLYALQPHLSITTDRMVKRAHKYNLKVFVWWHAYPLWKINLKKLRKIKPDGIITHNTEMKL